MIFYLFLILSLILILDIVIFRGNFCSPAILFTVGFWLSALWAWIFQDKWGGFQNPALLVLVSIGTISFSLGCLVVKIVYALDHPVIKPAQLYAIKISKYKLYLYLLLEVFIAIITIYVVLRNVSSRNLLTAIGQYYNANKYNRLVYVPSYLKVMQYFNISGVLLAGYIAINNKVCKKKNHFVLYLIIVFGMMISLLQGIRNTFFLFIISGVVMFYLLHGASTGWKSNFNLSNLPKIIFFAGIIIILFQITTMATGRSSNEFTFVETLSTYVGSPLKNLELYLSEKHAPSQVFGGQTLRQTYLKLYESTGNLKYNVISLYEYRWIGKTGLGNVYTILMPLCQDFGFIGTSVILFAIGAVSEWMYERLQRYKNIAGINYGIIIYAYCAFSIFFSFFSNKYFEMVVSVAFVYILISLFIIKKFFANVKFRRGKIIIYRTDRLHKKIYKQIM